MNNTNFKKQAVHLIHFTSCPGGIEVLLPVLVNNLAGYDFKGFVIREQHAGDSNIYDSLKIPVEYGSGNKIKALLRAFHYFIKYRHDIFQAFNIGPLFLLLMRLSGIKKVIYSIHGTIYWNNRLKKIFLKSLWRISLKTDYRIISNSEYSKRVFLNKISHSANVQVIYNPIENQKFKPSDSKPSRSGLKIIYAGRLCKGKNLERWVEIASVIHDSFPDAQFEIYGNGPLINTLKNQIGRQNLDRFIFLMGFREDIENVYRGADVLLFLSEYESFGNVAVESILCGTPVIVSDIPSMKEIFRDFPEFLIKIGDKPEDSILYKLKDISKLKELTIRAREQFLDRFSVNAHASALERIYQSFNV